MPTSDTPLEIMPGLQRETAAEGRIVLWTFAPPAIDPNAMSIPASYYEEQLLPLATAWKKAVLETLTAWPADQPYLALHYLPTLGDLIGSSALNKLAKIDVKNIWLAPDGKPSAEMPQPSHSRLALMVDPTMSVRFKLPRPEDQHMVQIFFTSGNARAEALAWLKEAV